MELARAQCLTAHTHSTFGLCDLKNATFVRHGCCAGHHAHIAEW